MGRSLRGKEELGIAASDKRALIIYDPDPFYNLDEQVCLSFGRALSDSGLFVNVATAAAAGEIINAPAFDVYVICANTYNWRPDWAITRFIEEHGPWEQKSIVAITLGSGSTASSQKKLEKLIVKYGGKIMDSRSLWLMRPNDESRMEESNVEVARSIAYRWGLDIAGRVKSQN